MHGVTLRSILSLKEMKDVIILTGEKGLDRVVKSVNVMEVPDIGDWVKEGELLLTTGFAIKDDNDALRTLIPLLNSKKLAGLAIKPKRYISPITKEVIDIAEALDFPIIEFPYYMSYSDLISPVLKAITNDQANTLNKIEDAHNRIMEMLTSHGDIIRTTQTIRELISNPIEIRDISENILSTTLDEKELQEIKDRQKDNELERINVVKLPIIALNDILGNLYCYEMYNKLTKVDYYTLERAIELIALELLNRDKIKEIAKHYRNQFLMELLDGSICDDGHIIDRGYQLDWKLDQPMSVMLIDINFVKKDGTMNLKLESMMNKINSKIRSIMESFEKNPIVGTLDTMIILLIPVTKVYQFFSNNSPDTLLKLGHYIEKQLLSEAREFEANICIGKVYNSPKDLTKSYNEAKKVLRMVKSMYSKKKVFYYEDLGIYKLFDNLNQEGIDFINDMLFPLIEYDEKKDSDLMETLGGYFKSNCNIKQMAQMLYIHYNTALYRIEQIQKLLNIDLKNPDDKLNVEIALKLSNYIGSR